MKQEYVDWIKTNVPDYASAFGQCASVTEKMAEAFPELKRVRGHYYCYAWGERAHWWLVTPDKEIVDPTCEQFPSKGRGQYDEWDESKEMPVISVCANCGEEFEGTGTCCSSGCHSAYVAYCINPL